jgi:voltage-gated sodium channel
MTAVARRLVESRWFDPLMLGVIAVNAVVLGLETYEHIDRDHGGTLGVVNEVILGVFVLELLIRMAAVGFRPKAYFSSGWNVFDFLVVTASFVPGVRENATMLRLARLLRITRAVRLLPDLRVLTVAVARSIPGVASLAVITVLLVFVYGMVGWLIFDDFAPAAGAYEDIGQAMLTMFVMLSLENVPDNLAMGQELSNWTLLFFISYVLLASFLIFNLFIGIVINSMEEAREIELHKAERELLDEDASNDEHAHQVILAERVRVLKQAVESLERELAAASSRR